MTIRTFQDYEAAYRQSVEQPEQFWGEIAQSFRWQQPWTRVLQHDFTTPDVRWFLDGKLNITENCLDRHLPERADQPAFLVEPNAWNPTPQAITYGQLHAEVCRLANAMLELGVQSGDRVCIYLPMIPTLPTALLACARIGAVHSVIFGGFSASALADRIEDAKPVLVITSDGAYRGAKSIGLKSVVDEALAKTQHQPRQVLVYRHTGDAVSTLPRDIDYREFVSKQRPECPAVAVDSEHPLFILYTSGSTGKPKGVLHTTGGYMVYARYTFETVFQYQAGDVFFCSADIGWVTGHTYITYAPLLAGATQVLFEGIPTYPEANRFWKIIEKYRVTHFYTAPTALRSLMAMGDEWTEGHDLGSIKVLGSVGEPINEEAWHWYQNRIGRGTCPVVDTWWQTETGGILISAIAGVTPLKPAHAGLPLPGVQPVLLDAQGQELQGNDIEGILAIKFPFPSILRSTYGDHERCRQTYFAPFPGYYFTGDAAKRDADGYYRIIGRIDDVINVSGHRLGTAEIENALDEHPDIVESAVVPFPHPIKGEGIHAYVVINHAVTDLDLFKKQAIETVARLISPIAKPDRIQIAPALPKTRSGKIMRRILRKIAAHDTSNLGDTSTLLNPEIVSVLIDGAQGF